MHRNGLQKITISIFRSLRQRRTRCPKPLMTLNTEQVWAFYISGVPFKSLEWSVVSSTTNTCGNNSTWQILERHVLSKTGPPNNHPPPYFLLLNLPPTLPDHQTSYSSNDQILVPSRLSVSEVQASSFPCSRMFHMCHASILMGICYFLNDAFSTSKLKIFHQVG